jgi:hypothetical protein
MRRYYAGEIEAGFAVHLVGTMVGAIGAAVLIALAATSTNLAVSFPFSPTASARWLRWAALPHTTSGAPRSGETFCVGWIMRRFS